MTKRPGVLVLIKGLGVGGAERLVAESADWWDRDSFDYRVAYVLPWKDQLVPDLGRKGVEVHLLGGRRGMTPAVPGRLRALIARHRIDLVHAHLPSTGIAARLVSPVPVVYTEHNVAGSYRQPTRAVNRLTYRLNRIAIAVSEAVAESLRGYRSEVRVIPNGVSTHVDESEVPAIRRELGIGTDESLVVHVGNIRPHKGHRTLLAAAPLLLESHPTVALVSIGGEKYEGDLDRVRTEAAALGVADRVRFLGRKEDARPYLAAADVVVNPSDHEGLPVTLLEALSLARPVAATAVGGVPAVIRHEETGLLVPPGDPVALAEAVGRLLDEPDVAAAMGKAGRDLVEHEYGIEPMVRAVEDVYREVLGG